MPGTIADWAGAIATVLTALGGLVGGLMIQANKLRKEREQSAAQRSDFHRVVRERDAALAETKALAEEAARLRGDNKRLRIVRDATREVVPPQALPFLETGNAPLGALPPVPGKGG